VLDFGAFPPEFNSARMYAGPGSESMLVSAAAWNGLAAELRSTAASYESIIMGLTDGSWMGPSSAAMEAAATPYVEWLNATAVEAEMTAIQAQAAAGSYQAAFAMTVPPPLIAENRALLMQLVATNLLGQNTPAISTLEAQYGEMWAQDAGAMYTYAANSAAITSKVKPLTAAPETTNLAGLVAQDASDTGNATNTGTQSTLQQLISALTQALNGLSSPGSTSTGSSSTLASLLSSLLGGSSSSGTVSNGLSSIFTSGGPMSAVLDSALTSPITGGTFLGIEVLGSLISTPMSMGFTNAAAPAADAAGAAAAGAADAGAAAAGDIGAGLGGGLADLGGLSGLGQAAAVGGLSVPANWGWAATAPAGLLGSAPILAPAGALAAGATDLGAGFGFPFMFPGMPGVAAAASGAGGGGAAAAARYGVPLAAVMTRPPAAGYGPEGAAKQPPAAYPVPSGFPTNGHAPPGYQPAIVYLPTNGDKKSKV
jgi:PPE-repeat protein